MTCHKSHRKGDLGDEMDGMQRKRRRRLQRVPEAFERCSVCCCYFRYNQAMSLRLGGNGDVGEIAKSLNGAGVLMMSTLVSCVQRFSIHDLLLVVSSQHLCNVVFTGSPGVPDLRSAVDTAEGANFVIFDRAGDSTGGVKDKKGLWLACPSTGNSTGGRAHGSTTMLCFVLTQKSHWNMSGMDRRETGFFGHCLGSWPL